MYFTLHNTKEIDSITIKMSILIGTYCAYVHLAVVKNIRSFSYDEFQLNKDKNDVISDWNVYRLIRKTICIVMALRTL
jgi:hypothetical protein